MNAIANTKTIGRYAVLDVSLLAAACLIPALSHITALPLYMLNPMLALLLVGMLIGRDWRNALVLAVLMPLTSSLIVGMPTAPKMVCMMAELATIAGLFHLIMKLESLSSKFKPGVFIAVFLAIVSGKLVYYALKALIIAPAVLVGTEWTVQLLAVMLWGGVFALLYRGKSEE